VGGREAEFVGGVAAVDRKTAVSYVVDDRRYAEPVIDSVKDLHLVYPTGPRDDAVAVVVSTSEREYPNPAV
jgi:hypothetical protein